MTVPTERERTRRRGRRTHAKARTTIFFFGFILIFCQLCVCSAAEGNLAPPRWSPGRKARFFNKGSFHAASRTNVFAGRDHHENNGSTGDNNSYEDEKRLVHTGPNPLHN